MSKCFPIAFACLLILGCGSRAPVEIDIVEVGPARTSLMAAPAGPTEVALDVDVRATQLAAALDRRAAIELAIVDCGAPDAARATVPLSLGGEPVNGLNGSQVSSDNPDMQVLLSAAVPRAALATPQPCGKLVRDRASSGPEIASRSMPLRR